MNDSETLFEHNDDESSALESPVPDSHLPKWQVDQIRVALNRAGFSTQEERKGVVEAVINRSVEGLHELTPTEAGQLRDSLHRVIMHRGQDSDSAWDMRDQDTWIDRM